jgi:hypothetical protein
MNNNSGEQRVIVAKAPLVAVSTGILRGSSSDEDDRADAEESEDEKECGEEVKIQPKKRER